jgi:hypothetical protein
MTNSYLGMTQRFDFKRDSETGLWIGPDGYAGYKTKAGAMYHMLGLCSCGRPHEVHAMLVECMQQFDGDLDQRKGVEGVKEVVTANPDAVAQFIAHFFDGKGLLEHGGSVFDCWITDRGKQFVEIGPMGEDVDP